MAGQKTYADLVVLCQFLPKPGSSQVGIAIGQLRAGYAGALAAWAGFTLPSAVALVLFAYGVDALSRTSSRGTFKLRKPLAPDLNVLDNMRA